MVFEGVSTVFSVIDQVNRWRGDHKAAELMKKSLREALRRELSLNVSLLDEAMNLSKRIKQPLSLPERGKLLKHQKFDIFNAILASGYPLSELVPGDFEQPHDIRYKRYIQSIITNSDLVEKAFHRLKIHQILSETQISKRIDSFGYATYIGRLAIKSLC